MIDNKKGGDVMLKKKQIVVIATIALVSFLMGAMLNVSAMAIKNGGNPFDKIWEAISNLDERLTALEEIVAPPPLTVVGPWSGAEMEAFLPVLEAFTEKTDIEVDYRIYRAEDLATLLPAQFAARTAPGDVIFMWAWFISNIGPDGHALDVTDLIDEADFQLALLIQSQLTTRFMEEHTRARLNLDFGTENRSSTLTA